MITQFIKKIPPSTIRKHKQGNVKDKCQMLSLFSLAVTQEELMCETGWIKIAKLKQTLCVCFKTEPPQRIEDNWLLLMMFK